MCNGVCLPPSLSNVRLCTFVYNNIIIVTFLAGQSQLDCNIACGEGRVGMNIGIKLSSDVGVSLHSMTHPLFM